MTEPIQISRHYYGSDEHRFGDLRIPAGSGPFPAIIIVHGGFWRARVGLNGMNKMADRLTNLGVVTWNIEYNRVGHELGGWPGTLLDVASAADYLRTLAGSYPIDLNRVLTMGHSAGGQLALWLAARHRLPAGSVLRTTDDPLKIHAAVSSAGVIDMALMYEVHRLREVQQHLTDNPAFELLSGDPKAVPERYAEASPVELLPIGVKQLLLHGSLDIHVPVGISYRYHQAAKRAGDDVKLVEIPTAEHFKMTNPESDAWPTIEHEVRLLLKELTIA